MFKLNNIKKYYIFRSLNKRFVLPIWFLYMLDQGLSIQQIAIIGALSTALSFILEVPSGSVADAIGHRRALVISMIAQGTAMLMFLGGDFWWILGASLMYFGLGTLMTGTHQALLFEYLQSKKQEKEFRKIMGRARSISSGWSMVGTGLSGFVYSFSVPLTFLIGGALFYLGGIVVSRFDSPQKKTTVSRFEKHASVFAHIRRSVSTLTSSKAIVWLWITDAFLIGFAFAATEFQQIIFTNVGLAVFLFGIFYATKRFFSMVLAAVLHRITANVSPFRIISILLLCLIAYYWLFPTVTHPVAILLVILLVSLIFVVSDIVIGDFKNKLIPTGSRATTLSIGNMMQNLVQITGIILIGTISTFFTLETTHVIIGTGILIISPLLLIQIYRHTNNPKLYARK